MNEYEKKLQNLQIKNVAALFAKSGFEQLGIVS